MTPVEALAAAIRDVSAPGQGIRPESAYRLHAALRDRGFALIPTDYPSPEFDTDCT